jgi:transcriptional regulator with XRE-family HTH domain
MNDSEKAVKKYSLRSRRIGLRKFRKQVGLSLKEVAGLAGLSQSMVSKFELGHRDLSPEAYRRLERAIVKALAHQEVLAERKQEAEKREVAKAEKTAGTFITLGSLMLSPTLETYQKSCKAMEESYGPQWRETFKDLREAGKEIAKLERQKANLESRIAELRDLLGLETHKALDESNAQEIRDRIAEREKKETTPKDGDD